MSEDQVVKEVDTPITEHQVRELFELRAWVSLNASQFPVGGFERLAEHAGKHGARLIIREAGTLMPMHRSRIAKDANGAVTFEL